MMEGFMTKVQMAVISTYHIYELWKARWIENEGTLAQEEIVELVYRYSREIGHSDKNLERMEKMMLRDSCRGIRIINRCVVCIIKIRGVLLYNLFQ